MDNPTNKTIYPFIEMDIYEPFYYPIGIINQPGFNGID